MKSTFVEDWAAAESMKSSADRRPRQGLAHNRAQMSSQGFCHAVSSWSPAGATWLNGDWNLTHCAERMPGEGGQAESQEMKYCSNSPHLRKLRVSPLYLLETECITLGATERPPMQLEGRRLLQPRGLPPLHHPSPGPQGSSVKTVVCGCMYHHTGPQKPFSSQAGLPGSSLARLPFLPLYQLLSSFFFFSLQYLHEEENNHCYFWLNKMEFTGHLHGDCRSFATFSLRHAVKI